MILFDTIVRLKGNLEHETLLIQQCCNISTLACIIKVSPLPGQRSRHASTVGNLRIVLSEKILLLLHPHVDVSNSLVVHNLSLDGDLCLRDGKNVAFL